MLDGYTDFFFKPSILLARNLHNFIALATVFSGKNIFMGQIIHSSVYKAKIQSDILLYETKIYIEDIYTLYILCKLSFFVFLCNLHKACSPCPLSNVFGFEIG